MVFGPVGHDLVSPIGMSSGGYPLMNQTCILCFHGPFKRAALPNCLQFLSTREKGSGLIAARKERVCVLWYVWLSRIFTAASCMDSMLG